MNTVNVVIVGHLDHGKSTLIGRLLYDSDAIPDDRLAEMQKLLEEYKKRFEFAYFIDSFEEELKEERTIDTTRVLFKSKSFYTVVDVPGHKEFIKNMLTGASHAQVAILVVAAPDGIQEQTRRHTFLLNMLGIKNIIVAINKMDLVDYSQQVFNRLKREVSRLLDSFGYKAIEFVPVSAVGGDNVYKPSTQMDWYHGSTLIQVLDELKLEETGQRPLRFVVQDTYQVDSQKVAVGRIESGVLRAGDELIFQPSGIKTQARAIKVYPDDIPQAGPSDSIGVVVDTEIKRGNVGGLLNASPVPVTRFLGEVVLLEGNLARGEILDIKCATRKVVCRVENIKQKISSETGEVLAENVDRIGENEAAVVVFASEPLVAEKFSVTPELGRFIIERKGRNIGAGIVLDIMG